MSQAPDQPRERSVAEALEAEISSLTVLAATYGVAHPGTQRAQQRLRDLFFGYASHVRATAYEDGRHVERIARSAVVAAAPAGTTVDHG